MNEHSEQTLLAMLRGNEQRQIDQALSQLYRQYYEPVQQLIRKNSGTVEEADDIFQEVLLAFYTQLREGKMTLHCSIKTYLYSVARNMWLNELRKRSNKPTIVETDEFIVLEEDHLASMVLTEQNQEMAKLIRSLGDQCQEILTYFYFDRFRMKKVADLMGFANEQVAKNKKSKCLKKLKALVQEKRHRFQS